MNPIIYEQTMQTFIFTGRNLYKDLYTLNIDPFLGTMPVAIELFQLLLVKDSIPSIMNYDLEIILKETQKATKRK